MSDPNSTSPDILSDGPVKDILRPEWGANLGPGYKIMLSLAKLKHLTNGNMSTYPGLEFAPQ
jgi:hypothetical protein